jgi:hypothetical protein
MTNDELALAAWRGETVHRADEATLRDAARWRWRWRWLREQSKQVAPVVAVVRQTPVNSGNWVNTSDLDANVDLYVEHDE